MPIVEKDYTSDVEAIEKITALFKAERMVYLCVTIVSLVMLLVCAGITIFVHGERNEAVLGMLFGSTGLITYSTSRLLHMWDQAMDILKAHKGGGT